MAASSKTTVLLKAVKKIVVQFSPFESNARSTREFLAMVGSEKVRATNANCEVSTVVRHDATEPEVKVTYMDGEVLLMKAARLTSTEMMSSFQSRCLDKDPQAKAAAKH